MSEIKFGNTLVSSRADETLTYTKYVKDEETGKSAQEQIDEIVKDKVNKTDKLGTGQIADGAVTNEKIAEKTLTINKFDDDFRQTLEAATGLPEGLIEKIQNVSEDIVELKDSQFPLVPSLYATNNSDVTNTTVTYQVSIKGEKIVPDAFVLKKNDTLLTNIPQSEGILTTPIEANKEVFNLTVSKSGKSDKSTSLTRYLCYCGGNSASTISADVINALTRKVSSNVSFNPSVRTGNGDYIWLVVPSNLTIKRVTSAGFDVTLNSPQTVTTQLGEFKAYRTLNPLTEQTWNLVIS